MIIFSFHQSILTFSAHFAFLFPKKGHNCDSGSGLLPPAPFRLSPRDLPLSHGFNYHCSADLSNAFVVMVPPLISISRLPRFSGNFHLEFCHHFKLLMSKSKLLICALAKFICFSLYIFSSTFQSSKFKIIIFSNFSVLHSLFIMLPSKCLSRPFENRQAFQQGFIFP